MYRDTWLIGVGNCVTSIYAGFVVFGSLGVLAEHNGVPVPEVMGSGGEGLAFQVYPEAILNMPGFPPIFNFLFFFMLCLLAMSSIVGMWEPCVAALLDEIPSLRKHRTAVYLISCFSAFLGGISMCFSSGIFMFGILNDHTANSIVYFAVTEVVVVAWAYGTKRLLGNIEEMGVPIPRLLRYYWVGCWSVVSPILCIVIIIISLT